MTSENHAGGGACAAVGIKPSRHRRRGLPSPTCLRQTYLRQVAPVGVLAIIIRALFVQGRGPGPYLVRLEVRGDVGQIPDCFTRQTPDRSGLPSVDRGAGAERSSHRRVSGTSPGKVIRPLRCERNAHQAQDRRCLCIRPLSPAHRKGRLASYLIKMLGAPIYGVMRLSDWSNFLLSIGITPCVASARFHDRVLLAARALIVRAVFHSVWCLDLHAPLFVVERLSGLVSRRDLLVRPSRKVISSRGTKITCPIGMLCDAEIVSPGWRT